MKHTPRAQAGLNLIELLLVLAIVVAIAVAAFILYPRVQASRAASSEGETMSSAIAQVQAVYTRGAYGSLDNAVAAKADVFPASMIDGTNIYNQWGGAVTIAGSLNDGTTDTTSAARYISIVSENVPSNVCKKLVPSASSNFGAVKIGSDFVFNDYANPKIAMDEADVIDKCDASDPVTLTFVTR